jgi:hypothetical protein
MKNALIIVVMLISSAVFAQNDMAKMMEKRARDMHKAIVSNNKTEWKTFIKENYTETLINKPMRAQKVTSENGSTSSRVDNTAANIDSKADMFAQLHDDFGSSNISSLIVEVDKVTMTLRNEQMTGVFTLRFENKSPWLIDGLGIEVEN